MGAPKARPSRLEDRCANAKCCAIPDPQFGCDRCGEWRSVMVARWGHEWALVAWLAENEKRQGALYQWLGILRGMAARGALGKLADEMESAPEDAMQILAVNL